MDFAEHGAVCSGQEADVPRLVVVCNVSEAESGAAFTGRPETTTRSCERPSNRPHSVPESTEICLSRAYVAEAQLVKGSFAKRSML